MANPSALNLILTSNYNAVPVSPSLGDIKVIVSRGETKQEKNKRNLVSPEGSSRILSEENGARRLIAEEARRLEVGKVSEPRTVGLCSSRAFSEPSFLVSQSWLHSGVTWRALKAPRTKATPGTVTSASWRGGFQGGALLRFSGNSE